MMGSIKTEKRWDWPGPEQKAAAIAMATMTQP